MRKTVLLISFLAIACAPSLSKLLGNLSESVDPTYGYTAENPIRIGYYGSRGSIEASYAYLSCLRGPNGEPLQLLVRMTVEDPINPMAKPWPPRAFDPGLSSGLLDAYQLAVLGTRDTVFVYMDVYHKGPMMVPKGLSYACKTEP